MGWFRRDRDKDGEIDFVDRGHTCKPPYRIPFTFKPGGLTGFNVDVNALGKLKLKRGDQWTCPRCKTVYVIDTGHFPNGMVWTSGSTRERVLRWGNPVIKLNEEA